MEQEAKEFYVKINGEIIPVTEEVYRAYVRPLRSEKKRIAREKRCIIEKRADGKRKYVRCEEKCSICPYAYEGKNLTDHLPMVVSLENLGFEINDETQDVETQFDISEENKKLYEAIAKLTPRQQEMVKMIYFEGMAEQEVANHYGITQQAVNNAVKKILKHLKKIFLKGGC